MIRRYRILQDPLNQDVGLVLTATDQMVEDFKEYIPKWIEDGRIEWVDKEEL